MSVVGDLFGSGRMFTAASGEKRAGDEKSRGVSDALHGRGKKLLMRNRRGALLCHC